jgi:hypothetical protein
MSASSVLQEIEKLTGDMLLNARQEQWSELSSSETRRRALLAQLGPALLAPSERQALQRIAENNREITRIAKDRRDDIGLLLSVFGDQADEMPG